jgi:SAM-dependent methyltransferase
LINQSRFLGDLTAEVLRRAGIGAGMRVLDVGCGAGDVSFLAASLVGPTGAVIGIDRAGAAVQWARERAAQAELGHVTFRQGDVTELEDALQVDALVGRFVLLYFPQPVEALRRLRRVLGGGGLMVFQEMDITTARSVPPVPLCESALGWIRETFRRAGVELDMGSRLHATFRRAGLPEPEMLLRGRIEGRADSPVYEYVTSVLRTLLPTSEQLGVVTESKVDIDTLAERLRDDVVRAEAVVIPPLLVGAWTTVP